jgi:hypothetical protein
MHSTEVGGVKAVANAPGSRQICTACSQGAGLGRLPGTIGLVLLSAFLCLSTCRVAQAGDRLAAGARQNGTVPTEVDATSRLSKSDAQDNLGATGGLHIAQAAPSTPERLRFRDGTLGVASSSVTQSPVAAAAAGQGPELLLLILMLLGMSLAVPATSLATSFAVSAKLLATARQRPNVRAELRLGPIVVDDDPAGPCRTLVDKASYHWRLAETAVLSLDNGLPLRTLLMSEMTLVGQRLATNAAVGGKSTAALTVRHTEQYWRILARQLKRCIADLQRICAVAEASRASFGTLANPEPRMPATRDDAYFVLGASSSVDDDTLRRLVRALRQCWHPDLARDDKDRQYRDLRIRQINVASDLLLSQKQA